MNLELKVNRWFKNKSFGEITANLINFYKINDIDDWMPIYFKAINQWEYANQDSNEEIIAKIDKILFQYKEALLRKLEQSKIVYTFHIGPYRLYPMILLALGFDVKLLVADHIRKEQLLFYEAITKRINFASNSDQNVISKLKNSTNENEKIFVYYDGNIGSGKYHSQSKNFFTTEFLGQTLFFHQGLPFISYFHIQPVLCFYLLPIENGYELVAHQHLETGGAKRDGLKEYCNLASSVFSKTLESTVAKHFIFWENLFAIHTWIKNHDVNTTNFDIGERDFFNRYNLKNVTFNIFRYFPFEGNNALYMLDRKTYRVHEIKKPDYQQFRKEVNSIFIK
jgi:hypothetical protein